MASDFVPRRYLMTRRAASIWPCDGQQECLARRLATVAISGRVEMSFRTFLVISITVSCLQRLSLDQHKNQPQKNAAQELSDKQNYKL